MTSRAWRAARVAGAIAPILLATLPPSADKSPKFIWFFGAADAICNLLLFLPLGMALYDRNRGAARAVAWAAALSSVIELAQLFIRGRHTSPGDVLCNVAGAAVGWWLASQAPAWLDPPPARARRLGLLAGAVALIVLAGSLGLFAYAPSRDDYFAQWTPEQQGQGAIYDGRVVAADFGGSAAVDGRLPDKASVDAFMRGERPFHATVIAGTPAAELADVFKVAGIEKEILLLGARGPDLALRFRTIGRVLGLNRPLLVARGALAHADSGRVLDIEVSHAAGGWCIRVDASRSCGLGHTPGDGWQLLFAPGFPEWLLAVVGFCWLAGVMTPVGYWAGPLTAAAFGVVSVAVLYELAVVLAEPLIMPREVVALAFGVAAGGVAWRLRQPRQASLATSSRQRSIRS